MNYLSKLLLIWMYNKSNILKIATALLAFILEHLNARWLDRDIYIYIYLQSGVSI